MIQCREWEKKRQGKFTTSCEAVKLWVVNISSSNHCSDKLRSASFPMWIEYTLEKQSLMMYKYIKLSPTAPPMKFILLTWKHQHFFRIQYEYVCVYTNRSEFRVFQFLNSLIHSFRLRFTFVVCTIPFQHLFDEF